MLQYLPTYLTTCLLDTNLLEHRRLNRSRNAVWSVIHSSVGGPQLATLTSGALQQGGRWLEHSAVGQDSTAVSDMVACPQSVLDKRCKHFAQVFDWTLALYPSLRLGLGSYLTRLHVKGCTANRQTTKRQRCQKLHDFTLVQNPNPFSPEKVAHRLNLLSHLAKGVGVQIHHRGKPVGHLHQTGNLSLLNTKSF